MLVGGALVNDLQPQFGVQPEQTDFSKLAISQHGAIAIIKIY